MNNDELVLVITEDEADLIQTAMEFTIQFHKHPDMEKRIDFHSKKLLEKLEVLYVNLFKDDEDE